MKFILTTTAIAIHGQQLAEHGGSDGIRDQNALELAMSKPQQLEAYGDPAPDLADLAAAYAFGIARNHPFTDGNKRTSLVITRTYLALNGRLLRATNEEKVTIWLAIAAGEMEQDTIAAWIRDRI